MSEVDHAAMEWVSRQDARELDERERAEFDAWYQANPRHQGAYLRARAILHALNGMAEEPQQRPATRFGSVAANAANTGAPLHGRRRWIWSGLIAAGLAAVAVVPLTQRNPPTAPAVFETALGEVRSVTLADGSRASINSASLVEADMSGQERRLKVKRGEAWFDVRKDPSRPFIVEAGAVRLRALGTAFGVRRHAQGMDVYVTEGVVQLTQADAGGAVRLVAGDHAAVGGGPVRVTRDAALDRALAWREGKLVFQHRTLADAVADFNRYNRRQLVIVDPALQGKTFIGQYRIDQPEQFADDVHALLKVPVVKTAERISIGAAPAK
jgi:transmembrane sensor